MSLCSLGAKRGPNHPARAKPARGRGVPFPAPCYFELTGVVAGVTVTGACTAGFRTAPCFASTRLADRHAASAGASATRRFANTASIFRTPSRPCSRSLSIDPVDCTRAVRIGSRFTMASFNSFVAARS